MNDISIQLPTLKSASLLQKMQNNSQLKQNGMNDNSVNMQEMMTYTGKVNMPAINFKAAAKTYAGHEINLSEQELDTRNKNITTITLLKPDSPEYKGLAEGDKKALKHLVRAAKILDDVFLKQDHPKNMELKAALTDAAEEGDVKAQKTLNLFKKINGVEGVDRLSKKVEIFKGVKASDGRNFYPADLTRKEYQDHLIKILKEGKKDEAQALLSQRTIVVCDEKQGLKAIDYTEAFSKEFKAAADELDKSAKTSTNKDFAKYLTAQAKALRTNDNELDCEADRLWAGLQFTPLEFTIAREQYSDKLGGSVQENDELKALIEENDIDAQTKDIFGVCVGIVNQKGTEDLVDGYKEYLPELSELMPLKDQYEQSISSDKEVKQTMVDADLVYLSGRYTAIRGGITIARNLPNDDKLSVKRGHGQRNVYHRQARLGIQNPEQRQKRLEAILDSALHKYYDPDADHKFTIGHENSHSLGPMDEYSKSLGDYKSIIEESKADMGALASLDYLVEKGKYTEKEKNQILVTWAMGGLLKAKPKFKQDHAVRAVMQLNYFRDKGALKVNGEGKLHVNFEKMIPVAKQMLEDNIKLQLSKDPAEAKKFIKKYFKWDEKQAKAAHNLVKLNNPLHIAIDQPLAEKLLAK